jgi:ABC-2 type transport system ATP-binding protein
MLCTVMTVSSSPPAIEPAVEPAVEAAGLVKAFGSGTVALDGVSFTVAAGSVFGVIGPNGAGKTTIMRALLDLIRLDSGRATLLGTDSRNAGPDLRRRIGYLPGELILEGRSTGRRLLRHYADISGPVEAGRVDGLADRFSLDLDRTVRTLSKGNKQKLGIVQAFMHRPDLLVLDEPTSGLDPLMQQEFLGLVREAKDNGQTVFLSSHVISEIQQAADEVAILRAGRILTVAGVEALRDTAIRHLRLSAADITAGELHETLRPLPGVQEVECRQTAAGAEATAILTGSISPFVRVIAGLRLTDLVVEEPDLEESVLRLYSGRP